MSRTRDIVTKITQVIQDIGLIRSRYNKNTKGSKDEIRQGGKDLPYKHTPDLLGNNERNEKDYIWTEDNRCNPDIPDPPSSPDTPEHHAPSHQTYPSSLNLTLYGLDQTHTVPVNSPLPTSTAFELGEPCSTGDTAVQNKSSDSCAASSTSSPPSEEPEQDSKEGMEGEECPDPGGVGGMTGEDWGGSVQ
jgi:hypothetical protein